MSHYLRKGHPIKTNNPMPEDIPIIGGEIEYKKICKERNDKIEADRIKEEEKLKPEREREKLIKERMDQIIREQAEQELIDEGIIDPEEE